MKKIILATVLMIALAITTSSNAQVGIGVSTANLNSSAQLEVKSTTKGLLIPRMTEVQKTAIISPANGLLVYQTDGTSGFYYYNGSSWNPIVVDLSGYATTSGLDAETSRAQSAESTLTSSLATKANLASPSFTGTPVAPTASASDSSTKLATTEFVAKKASSISALQAIAPGTTGNVLTSNGTTWASSPSGGSVSTTKTTTGDPFDFGGTTYEGGALAVLTAQNLANGANVLAANTSGIANVGFGIEVLTSNTTGSANTAVGFKSLRSNTTGMQNTAQGTYALYSNTSASDNSAFGSNALTSNTTGYNNSAFGEWSLMSNIKGNQNTAFGTAALMKDTASNNSAFGGFALYSNFTGANNVAVGSTALYSNISGSNNAAVGCSALKNTTGANNVAVGSTALYYNTTGEDNIAVGCQALAVNTTAANNAAVGYQALYNNTGANNTAVGYQALISNTTGANNTAIGYGANVVSAALTNATAIGNGAIVAASNTIQLGNTSVTSVNTTAAITAAGGFKKPSGTSSQYLMADGSSSAGTVATTIGAIGVTPTANGGTITSGVLSLTPADGTNGGIVTNAAQTFAGKKTFADSAVAKGFRATDSLTTKGFRASGTAGADSLSTRAFKATGTATANSFVKSGGASSQYLMADGSITTASSIVIPDALPTIQIGTQKWMKENLNTSFYRNGDTIHYVTDATEWAGLNTGAWCYYNNDPENGEIYGKLYNWYAVKDSTHGGLAPLGWHVPADSEWTTLITKLGGETLAGGKMKVAGTARWTTPNTGATNSSGFAGLPGGCRASNGSFGSLGINGNWWSSTGLNATTAWSIFLYMYDSDVYNSYYSKTSGFSVRCLRD